MSKGGVCGKGACAWRRGACMAKGGMHGKGGACVVCTPPLYEIRPVNARAVRILLECILVQGKTLKRRNTKLMRNEVAKLTMSLMYAAHKATKSGIKKFNLNIKIFLSL